MKWPSRPETGRKPNSNKGFRPFLFPRLCAVVRFSLCDGGVQHGVSGGYPGVDTPKTARVHMPLSDAAAAARAELGANTFEVVAREWLTKRD